MTQEHAPGSPTGEEPVYEMLWDCGFCGHKKLLGLTHRFCANCGGPQNPATRYFPPDHEKVAVKDHPFVGADVVCPTCKQPMSRAAKCCTNCGGPIDKGGQVAMQADVVVPPPQYAMPAPPAAKKSNVGLILGILGGVFALIVVVILVVVLWKRDSAFTVAGHSWQRDIAIERYESYRKGVWCDEIPAGARVLSRKKEQKGTTKEKDGETCGTRKKDLGNGTFKEVKECTPKFKDVPVMVDKCEVELTEWHTTRTATEKGTSLAEAPRWPASRVSGGTCVGCEREGARTERYTVRFLDDKGKEATCDVPAAKWSTFSKGSKWKGAMRVMTSGVDCDTLQKK